MSTIFRVRLAAAKILAEREFLQVKENREFPKITHKNSNTCKIQKGREIL